MSALWHPALHADWLVLRRTGTAACVRFIGVPALLLVGCMALASIDFYMGHGWCLAVGILLALGGSHAVAYARLLGAAERWRFGWCGALPVAHGAARWTLLAVTTTALAASLVFVTAVLPVVAVSAPHRRDLAYALAGIDLALVAGVLSAMLRLLRPGAVVRAHHQDGIREPAFALSWLDDPRLPHLLDWQRRTALVKWRRGSGAVLVAGALFAVPDGASLASGAGLILFVIGLAWLATVMQACVEAATGAVELLRQMPWGRIRMRRAALRYPLLAMLCAMVLVGAAAALSSGRIAMAATGCACACAAAAWPLKRLAAMVLREGDRP